MFWNRSKFETVSSEELKQLLDEGQQFTLIDVRTPQEFASGHIPKAKNVPNQLLMEKIISVVPKKDAPLILYCHSGQRSKVAGKMLISMGYTNIRLYGGIIRWPYDLKK